ncbi:cupin-like domain-containing protein [Tenacibaculum sp. TC6]|uniref:cupin-like domain-containing protein n=1 Tax=Tenacibaculum sp. TC6 TaxID=3423223 RepID=UPI003D362F66
MEVTRVKNISEEIFIEKYIKGNQPVIVTDGMEKWDLERFTPENLKKEFGDEKVQVYNDLFDLQTIQSLEQYIDANFSRSESEGPAKQYIRWYTKLKEVEFYWSDSVFESLKKSWNQPYFIPSTSLVIPSNKEAVERNINEYSYPYKGLFISGRGSRTRLHKDPFMSNAVLCQFYGKKEIYLYSPNKEKDVMVNNEFVDVKNPDHAKFPNFKNLTPDYKDVLSPGEIIFFPSGWFHDVTCMSDSVSITWNFVHEVQLDRVCKHIEKNPEDDQLEIMRFFLRNEVPEDINSKELVEYLQNKFMAKI